MPKLVLRSDDPDAPKEREAVDPGEGRWPDAMFEPQYNELEMVQWFVDNVPGVRGKLFFGLACLCRDVEELQALRYAADIQLRYILHETEDEHITELHMNRIYIKNLEDRNTRLKYGFT